MAKYRNVCMIVLTRTLRSICNDIINKAINRLFNS